MEFDDRRADVKGANLLAAALGYIEAQSAVAGNNREAAPFILKRLSLPSRHERRLPHRSKAA